MKKAFLEADVLLPDFDKVDGKKWAVIACDQHTSELEYWREAEKISEGAPSTLNLILPEVYLEETEKRVPMINACMEEYLKEVFVEHKNSLIYLERRQNDGRIRQGLVGCCDLMEYEYEKGKESLIRATEGTVIERIPPRVKIRRNAPVELPHVMLLIDDAEKKVIEPLEKKKESFDLAYSFPLMLGGGEVTGYFISEDAKREILSEIDRLNSREQMEKKYGISKEPLLFAVGDGNHSLASAKAFYEEKRKELGTAAENHPSRYALVEIVNLHSDALSFEPIYRVLFGVNLKEIIRELKLYAEALSGKEKCQTVEYISKDENGKLVFEKPTQQLTVGTLQAFIDEYIKTHTGVTVDYIHGVEATKKLAMQEGAIGFLFDGMEKSELFKTVMLDGALPRKTFSMGHAEDKRYYIEARKIK